MNQQQKELLDAVEHDAAEVIDLARSLIRFPSENRPPHGDEGPCQQYVADWMGEVFPEVDVFAPTDVEGIESHPAFWPGRDYTNRPNVVGVLKGCGGGRSVIFNGHIDVVPKEPLPWVHDPYGATLENNRIYGRGSLDMKGGLAAAMMAARIVRKSGLRLAGDLILESVVDEEYAGANGTLACVLRGYTADAAVSPEPTWMTIGPATRCGRLYEIAASGVAGLPFANMGVANPAYLIARMALGVEAFDRKRNAQPVAHPIFAQSSWPQPASLVKLKAGQVEPGGTIGVPAEAWLHFWLYAMPEVTAEELDQEVRAFFDEWIRGDPALRAKPPILRPQTRFLEGSIVPSDHPILGVLAESFQAVKGRPGPVRDVEVTGDMGILAHWGRTPTVVLGPGGERLHAADEYVDVEDLLDLTRIYALMIADWCGIG